MQAQQILDKEDILQFNYTIKLLEQVKPLESSKGKKMEDLTKEESMQINISNLNRIVLKTLLSTLDTLSSQEKLIQVSKGLNSETPESVHQLIVQLTNRESLSKLFSDLTDL
jgi:glycerol-3-phosphate dehydrogenase